jgi:hypothetical protein
MSNTNDDEILDALMRMGMMTGAHQQMVNNHTPRPSQPQADDDESDYPHTTGRHSR